MYRYYFIFRSVTSAQRALQILRKKGIEAALTPAPGVNHSNGCGHAILVNSPWNVPASAALRSVGHVPVRVLRSIGSAAFEEVAF